MKYKLFVIGGSVQQVSLLIGTVLQEFSHAESHIWQRFGTKALSLEMMEKTNQSDSLTLEGAAHFFGNFRKWEDDGSNEPLKVIKDLLASAGLSFDRVTTSQNDLDRVCETIVTEANIRGSWGVLLLKSSNDLTSFSGSNKLFVRPNYEQLKDVGLSLAHIEFEIEV